MSLRELNWKRLTVLILCIVTTVLIVYDIGAFVYSGSSEGTISQVLLKGSKEYPVIAFALGFLMGHLFWPQPKE